MKLRTEMRRHPKGWWYVVDPHSCQTKAIGYDAAAAHALMQAMDDLIKQWGDGGCSFETTKALMLERADELMREWGFGETAE